MTTFQIDLHFEPMSTPEQVLGTLYTMTSNAIETHGLIDGYCNIHIPKGKKATIFAEVQIDAITNDVQYFVAKNPKSGQWLPALSYSQALSTLRTLLA